MAASEGVIAAIDRVIEYFNARRMDLPDGFFDRKTQFLVNGASFESMLSATPDDPLVLMLARGPAGFRFTAKALQHAIPDAKLQRGEVTLSDASTVTTSVWLSGKLRVSGTDVNALVAIALRMAPAGYVETAEATIEPETLQSIKDARVKP